MFCIVLFRAAGAIGKGGVISVNYDGFIDDVSVGDELLVDGGIISFVVRGKTDTDVEVRLGEGEYELHVCTTWYTVHSVCRQRECMLTRTCSTRIAN